MTVYELVDKTLIYRHLLRAVLRAPGAGRLTLVMLLRSERAARRVMESMTDLEETLGLPVNRDKSQVAPVKEVEFLGFQILRGIIRISTKARRRFKNRMRDLTRRNNGLSMIQAIRDLPEYLRGWVSYFRIREFRKVFKELDGFIRRRSLHAVEGIKEAGQVSADDDSRGVPCGRSGPGSG